MKKLFLLLSAFFALSSLNAQSLVISNGEDIGTAWWQVGSTAVELVGWHPKTDNPSATSMTIWISTTSDQWSGGGLDVNINVSTYNTISLLVYKNVTGKVQIELQDGTNKVYLQKDYTTPGAWQKLEYTIPSGIGNITKLLVAPFIDYNLSTIVGEQSRCFWDDVTASYTNNTATETVFSFNENAIVKTEIYSLTGKLIKAYTNKENVSLKELNKGFYLVKKTDDAGNHKCDKILVN